MDENGDNAVALAEFDGPRDMFDPFDIDRDEVIRSHELLAARRIDQFTGFAAPETDAERVTAARRFRDEVPGAIPVLVDPIGEPTAQAYGRKPNSAFVIGADGKIAQAMEWASVREVQAALVRITGRAPVTPVVSPALDVLAPQLQAARHSGKPVLVQFTAPGCAACQAMHDQTLQDPEVRRTLGGFEHVSLGVELDAHWALFEAFELATTPAFVVLAADGTVQTRVQGFQPPNELLAALRPARR
jgi:thiol-disulfide isomerase/thioredoxin